MMQTYPAVHDVKENVEHQTRPSSSVVLWTTPNALCPFYAILVVNRDQHGQTDWSVVTKPYVLQAVMHFVSQHFSIIVSKTFSSIFAIVALLWDLIIWVSLCLLFNSMRLVHPRPCHRLTGCPALDHF